MRQLLGLLVAGFLAVAPPVFAQGLPPISMPMPSGMNVGDAHAILWDNTPNARQSARRPTPQQRLAVTPGSLTFQISPARRASNLTGFISGTARGNRAHEQEMTRVLVQNDMFNQIDRRAQTQFGFQPNNLADAFTLWLYASWAVVARDDRDLTRAQFQGIRRDIVQKLAGTSITGNTDAVKQQVAEYLLFEAIKIQSNYDLAKADPAAYATLANALVASAGAYGFDLRAVTLSDNGLQPRSSAAPPTRRR